MDREGPAACYVRFGRSEKLVRAGIISSTPTFGRFGRLHPPPRLLVGRKRYAFLQGAENLVERFSDAS